MSEIDQIWAELHDLEGRVGRIEAAESAEHGAAEAVAQEKQRTAKRRGDLLNLALRAVPLVISLGSAALVALHLK